MIDTPETQMPMTNHMALSAPEDEETKIRSLRIAQLKALAYCGHDRVLENPPADPLRRLVAECDEFQETCAECRNRLASHQDAFTLGRAAGAQQEREKYEHSISVVESILLAVAGERERCAQLAEEWYCVSGHTQLTAKAIAAALRTPHGDTKETT